MLQKRSIGGNFKTAEIFHLLNEIWKILKGEERDYTRGNIRKAILLLSVPMVMEMMMESVFAVADIYFVSKMGADAIATVGITESIITLVYALAVGLSVGTSAIVSRRVGEKHFQEASIAAWQSILTGIVFSLLIAMPGIFMAGKLLHLMGASAIIVNEMSSYTAIMLGGNLTIMLLFIINAVFRSAGNPVLSMKVLWFANGINILLDPILIFGLGPIPGFGIKGAAIATTVGRGLAVAYQLYLLFYGNSRVNLKGINFKPVKKIIMKVLKLAYGSVSQYIVATSSWIVLMRIMAEYGSAVVAGYTIAIRIVIFALLPALGISNAASTLVGQNLGAGNPDRAERSVWITGKATMLLMAVIGFILVIWAGSFISLFTNDTAIIAYGKTGLRIVSYGFVGYGLGMVMVNAINGAGDTRTPLWINLISFWMIEIPLAWLLSHHAGWAQNGVFIAILTAESIMTIITLFIFRKGRWKLKYV